MDPIELSLFSSRIQTVCDEMGAVLRYAAFSPNIKDRLDYSCAVFDADGLLCAQAAHIPVHLGSMAYAMRGIVSRCDWRPGDMIILNDPYLGGTHLPDVTVIAPVFPTQDQADRPLAFVANRAHHADIGAASPGSMPLARDLAEEGVLLSPRYLLRDNRIVTETFMPLLDALNNPRQAEADFHAQISANHTGIARLGRLILGMGSGVFCGALAALNDYAETLARHGLAELPAGEYEFEDYMDDDGLGSEDIRIAVNVRIGEGTVDLDFSGTAAQVAGNINCPLSVTAAAVYYCLYCLMPARTPACAGSFRPIRFSAPRGCLINAKSPAAVAAGNVETSSRIVDVIFGALAQAAAERIPAASQGTMNNIAMGGSGWDYYETAGGGMGAGRYGGGLDGIQTHMTNTLNTPIEIVEMQYPLRIGRYSLRDSSGGDGQRHGGDGLLREYVFLEPTSVTLLTERRRFAPWGLAGGSAGRSGANSLNNTALPAKVCLSVQPGDQLLLATPGGGGWGSA
ncbi:MAG: hydantoinase B/oxoprolinase family protein [Gammaproteobacteria bacterium]|nr:hydantoinase B/oxoprolinase family protein [Gammaproteobacteria bacterium]